MKKHLWCGEVRWERKEYTKTQGKEGCSCTSRCGWPSPNAPWADPELNTDKCSVWRGFCFVSPFPFIYIKERKGYPECYWEIFCVASEAKLPSPSASGNYLVYALIPGVWKQVLRLWLSLCLFSFLTQQESHETNRPSFSKPGLSSSWFSWRIWEQVA